ncbi:site-specific integrase [Odoribacter laneus]|uniref:Phage integrase SAM-like domain-containing protein n=1 Tax=Odoribacter laneus YIT 12061 TaxID=742817 RepID=H1DHS1_9BACT|nr:site-specific integrase [Odoribacter laneus]EHP47200.1 hypothetical protein HMPREF9449_01807 [Odoribacter laneus YIT 12061]
MTTFKAVVQHSKRDQARFQLYIRITNKRIPDYLKTSWYVTLDNFDDKGNLKDLQLQTAVNLFILELQQKINKRFGIICNVTGKEIVKYLEKDLQPEQIDFLKFFEGIMNQMIHDNQPSGENYKASFNHLKRFIKKDKLPIDLITVSFLKNFEKYLLKQAQEKGFKGHRCVSLTLSNVRHVFNLAMEEYNDKVNGIEPIKHYPFTEISIKDPICSRRKSIGREEINKIINYNGFVNSRDKLAQDFVLLSICLAGINAVDLYTMDSSCYERGRLNYNRSKTKGSRDDEAYMSIAVVDEVKPLFAKYADESGKRLFNFYQRYRNNKNFIKAVNKGLKHICKQLDLPSCTTYTFRRSIAEIASDDLYISTSDIALILNHVSAFKTTMIYTGRSFKKVDGIVRMILNWILYEKYTPLIPQKKQIKKGKKSTLLVYHA